MSGFESEVWPRGGAREGEGPPAEPWWNDALLAAPRLIGCELVRVFRGRIRRGRIVETEAYLRDDPASHSYRGETPRNRAMFGPAGHAYVYRIHQVHCFNVVTGPAGRGEAVLVRAIEPLEGEDSMARARARIGAGKVPPRGVAVTNGPGKVCQALGITARHDGRPLFGDAGRRSGLYLRLHPPVPEIARSGRIGISRARELPLRFYEPGNSWVSPARTHVSP